MTEVIYQYQQSHVLADGKTLQSWVDCSEEYCESEKAEGGTVRLLYTATLPAILPDAFHPDGDIEAPLVVELGAVTEALDAAVINKIDPVYRAMIAAAPAPGGDGGDQS